MRFAAVFHAKDKPPDRWAGAGRLETDAGSLVPEAHAVMALARSQSSVIAFFLCRPKSGYSLFGFQYLERAGLLQMVRQHNFRAIGCPE